MTDTTVKPADNSAEGTPGGNPEQQQGDPAELGDAGKKALDAERKRADDAERAMKALQAQLQAREDASLTETQRLQKRLDDLQASYEAAQVEAIRNRVIAEQQIPANLAGFVTGDDEAALVASAQSLKAAVAEAAKPGTPAPDHSQGSHGDLPDPIMSAAPGAPRMAAAFERELNTKN